VDGFRSLKLHKKLNVVTYQNFIFLLATIFYQKKCMRIKSRAFFSQKQTCLSSCGNPKPSFQTQLWTDFSHSSSTRSSTWFTYQNFLWDPDKDETEIRVQPAKSLPRRCGWTLARSIICTEAQRSCEKRVRLFPRRGPSRVLIRPIFLKPESQPFKHTVIQFLPGFHLDLCRFGFSFVKTAGSLGWFLNSLNWRFSEFFSKHGNLRFFFFFSQFCDVAQVAIVHKYI
jgi:hypothetical protein